MLQPMPEDRPAELTAFLRALALGAELGHPVGADDIALVEAAWQIPDTVVSSHGWVLAMKDDRRFYIEYTLDDTRRAAEEIELTELQPAETNPVLEDDTGVYWYRPDHINAHLGITPPSLH